MGIRNTVTLVLLALPGCMLGAPAADVSQDHPASPSAREATYSPQPTPIASDDPEGTAPDDQSGAGMQGMTHGAMHHHHAGGK